MRIYSVEDDPAIRDLLVYALKQAGYEAEGFAEGQAFLEAVKRQTPDLALLDVMLPGEDGFALLRRLRGDAQTRGVAVIMLTAKDAEMDKVQGLETGADDYVVKPFGVMELLSRVKAVLRRVKQEGESAVTTLGAITLDAAEHRVYVGGEEITLTLKEFDLLKKLMANRGIALTREQLLDSVWGIEFAGDTRTVDVHAGTLRQKLGAGGDCIRTVRGVGYRMEE